MLDWFSGKVGYSGEELKLNRILEVTPDGSILWNSERKIQAKGSYESSIQIGRDFATEAMLQASERHNLLVNNVCLYMSGNPLNSYKDTMFSDRVSGLLVRWLWLLSEVCPLKSALVMLTVLSPLFSIAIGWILQPLSILDSIGLSTSGYKLLQGRLVLGTVGLWFRVIPSTGVKGLLAGL